MTRARLFVRFFLGAILIYLAIRGRFEADTGHMVKEAGYALTCLREGRFSGCTEAGQFPLFQIIPSMLLLMAGATSVWVSRVLVLLSVAAFLGSCWLIYETLQRKDEVIARLAVLIYLSGFALCYVNASFSEMCASFVTLALVALCLEPVGRGRSPWLVMGLAFAAGLTKDTAAPLLFFLCASCLLTAAAALELKKKVVVALAAGASLSLLASTSYNYFKFRSPLNLKYLQPVFLVPDLSTQWNFFWGVWLSPSGGVVFFWTGFVAVFCAVLGVLLSRSRDRIEVMDWIPVGSVAALLGAVTLGFSKWYAPFGWIAWGPRLMLPWLPACLIFLMHRYSRELRHVVNEVRARARLKWAGAIALGVLAFPHFRTMLSYGGTTYLLKSPQCVKAVVQRDAAHYYDCMMSLIWPSSFRLLDLYLPWPKGHVFVLAMIYAIILGSLWLRIDSEDGEWI